MQPIDSELFGTVHRAKKINSKVKGNKGELAAAKLLTQWLGTEVVRVPQSGGLHWQHSARVCGDIIVTDPTFDFIFSVEVKNYKNLGLKNGFDIELRKNSIIYKFFAQCQRDAEVVNKIPLLMVRYNGMKGGTYFIFLSLTLGQMMKIGNYVQPEITGELTGFHSKKFFKLVSFETLKWIYDRKSSGSK
jgi:Holliday junction resolvase